MFNSYSQDLVQLCQHSFKAESNTSALYYYTVVLLRLFLRSKAREVKVTASEVFFDAVSVVVVVASLFAPSPHHYSIVNILVFA